MASKDDDTPKTSFRNRVWPGDHRRGEIEVIKSSCIWKDPRGLDMIEAYLDDVRMPTGDAKQLLRFTTDNEGSNDGVVVVPIYDKRYVILVAEFRHATRTWMLNLPRGFARRDEQNRLTTRRELKEETGCTFDWDNQWSLGRLATDSGKLYDMPYLIAVEVNRDEGAQPDELEAISHPVSMTFDDLKKRCWSGEIVDMFTLAAVARLEPHFKSGVFQFDRQLATSGFLSSGPSEYNERPDRGPNS